MSIVKWDKESTTSSLLDGKKIQKETPMDSVLVWEVEQFLLLILGNTLLISSDSNYEINNQGVLEASSSAIVTEYVLENGSANYGSVIYKQDLEKNDYYIGINALIDDGNGNLYLALGKDENQSGTNFDRNIPQKDRILFVYNGPVISILPGQTTGSLEISGMKNFLKILKMMKL